MPHYRQMISPYSEIVDVTAVELEAAVGRAGIDAVVISGSQLMLSEQEPADSLLEFCRSLEVPTLGICFGHQLLARSFGAVIRRGERVLDFCETVELVVAWPLFEELARARHPIVMRESHREFVDFGSLTAAGWQVGARSASCPVEAIRHQFLPLYGVQFHPERSGRQGELLFAGFYRHVVAGA